MLADAIFYLNRWQIVTGPKNLLAGGKLALAEIVGLVIDFLTESSRTLLARKTRTMCGRIGVLSPTCPDSCDHLLGTVFIVRRR